MTDKKATMQDAIESILKTISKGVDNAKNGDVERANFCEASASGMTKMLRLIGVDCDFGDYQDGEVTKVGYLQIEGVEIVKNGEIDWGKYAEAVLSEPHNWGFRKVGE